MTVAQRLGMTTTTLYDYVNGDGTLKEQGQRLLDSAKKSASSRGKQP